jgi:hypothetical protein
MKAEGGFRDSELGQKISRIAQMNAKTGLSGVSFPELPGLLFKLNQRS